MDDNVSRKATLIVATMAAFVVPFMGSSVNIALPSIGREFALDAVTLNWVATSFLLATAMFLLPFGRIADIYGRKKIFTYGMIIFTLASLFSALSISAAMLISFGVLRGIGSAMIFSTGVAILTSAFPPEERGKVLGINVAAVYLGIALGPFFGGLLTQYLGWRSVFWINVPLGLLTIVVIFWKLKGEWLEAKGERFDFLGSLIYGASLAIIMYGFSELPNIWGGGLISIGIMGIIAFVRWETKIKSPLLNMNLLKNNRAFAFSNLAALLNYSATFGVAFILSLYLQYIKGLSPQNAGLVLVAQPTIQAIFSPFAGRLSDRIEPRIVASIGMAFTCAGLILLSFLTNETALPFIIACLIVLGFGFALFSSPNTNAIMSSVEKKFYGIASGTLGTMRLVGQMFSMGVIMLLFAIYIGKVQITPEVYLPFMKSGNAAFIIFAILCFGGIFASLIRGKIR